MRDRQDPQDRQDRQDRQDPSGRSGRSGHWGSLDLWGQLASYLRWGLPTSRRSCKASRPLSAHSDPEPRRQDGSRHSPRSLHSRLTRLSSSEYRRAEQSTYLSSPDPPPTLRVHLFRGFQHPTHPAQDFHQVEHSRCPRPLRVVGNGSAPLSRCSRKSAARGRSDQPNAVSAKTSPRSAQHSLPVSERLSQRK